MMGDEEKGSASAPTLPSRGSNNPGKGNAVNEHQGITAIDMPASFLDFEEPLSHLTMLTSLTTSLINEAFGAGNLIEMDGGSCYRISSERLGQIVYLAHNAAVAARSIERRYDEAFVDILNTPAELDALISAHVHAAQLLSMSREVDEGMNLGLEHETALTRALEKDEERTLEAILDWRPTTLAANALRMRYLNEKPWEGVIPGEKHLTLLFNSLSSAGEG